MHINAWSLVLLSWGSAGQWHRDFPVKFLQMYVTASMRKLCMCASQGGGTLRRWNSQRGGNLRGWNPQEWNSQGGGIHLLGTPTRWNSLAGDSSEVEFTCWGFNELQKATFSFLKKALPQRLLLSKALHFCLLLRFLLFKRIQRNSSFHFKTNT